MPQTPFLCCLFCRPVSNMEINRSNHCFGGFFWKSCLFLFLRFPGPRRSRSLLKHICKTRSFNAFRPKSPRKLEDQNNGKWHHCTKNSRRSCVGTFRDGHLASCKRPWWRNGISWVAKNAKAALFFAGKRLLGRGKTHKIHLQSCTPFFLAQWNHFFRCFKCSC